MTTRSKTLLTLAGAAFLALGFAADARAWDTAPWDPLPFDQSNQLDAAAGAKIARAEAAAMARAGAARTGSSNPAAAAVATDGQHNCATNLGNVVLPQGARGSADIVTNVQVTGDVITVCR